MLLSLKDDQISIVSIFNMSVHTLILRAFLSLWIFSAFASSEVADAFLKKVGSEYLFKQDPGPPVSNLNGKIEDSIK